MWGKYMKRRYWNLPIFVNIRDIWAKSPPGRLSHYIKFTFEKHYDRLWMFPLLEHPTYARGVHYFIAVISGIAYGMCFGFPFTPPFFHINFLNKTEHPLSGNMLFATHTSERMDFSYFLPKDDTKPNKT